MRGVHTISGENNVLFVVNGRPIGNSFNALESTVDVNDVQDIRVIRGSMGSQLYGIRGANGVVEITTKT
jgi:TonB-dependent SusC/RagA subfamily outer membrane receptor